MAELPASPIAFEPRRIEYFMALLETCKACRDHALTGDVVSLTASSILVFSYCIKILYRFSSIKGIPDWIPAMVQSTIDIVQCLERSAEIAEQTNAEFKAETGEDSLFAAAAETVRAMAPNWKLPRSPRANTMTPWAAQQTDGAAGLEMLESWTSRTTFGCPVLSVFEICGGLLLHMHGLFRPDRAAREELQPGPLINTYMDIVNTGRSLWSFRRSKVPCTGV